MAGNAFEASCCMAMVVSAMALLSVGAAPSTARGLPLSLSVAEDDRDDDSEGLDEVLSLVWGRARRTNHAAS